MEGPRSVLPLGIHSVKAAQPSLESGLLSGGRGRASPSPGAGGMPGHCLGHSVGPPITRATHSPVPIHKTAVQGSSAVSILLDSPEWHPGLFLSQFQPCLRVKGTGRPSGTWNSTETSQLEPGPRAPLPHQAWGHHHGHLPRLPLPTSPSGLAQGTWHPQLNIHNSLYTCLLCVPSACVYMYAWHAWVPSVCMCECIPLQV